MIGNGGFTIESTLDTIQRRDYVLDFPWLEH